MSRRNSLDKAMKQMGFIPEGNEGKRNNATMLWKDKERNRFKISVYHMDWKSKKRNNGTEKVCL